MATEHKVDAMSHERIETSNTLMIVLIVLVVAIGGLVEIVPLFFQRSTTEAVPGLKPYTALQLAGRDIYVREGCYNCHSQMIRPFRAETLRYGPYSQAGEFVYDHPFQWGSKRTGPDLAREGGRRDELWHLKHLENPRSTSIGSVMPSYPHLLDDDIPWDVIQSRVDAMAMLGVPYDGQALVHADSLAFGQAKQVARALVGSGGPKGMETKEVIALIAYLQRLGRDIQTDAQGGSK
jgi:cbb3-type cytochrome c oxidase subunit II